MLPFLIAWRIELMGAQILTEDTLTPAPRRERLAGFIVDVAITNVISGIFGLSYGITNPTGEYYNWVWIIPFMTWGYYTITQASDSSATLGQKMMKIKVTKSNGERIGWGRAALRNFVLVFGFYPLNGAIFIFNGLITLLFKKGIHDIVSGSTVVVKKVGQH
jgi:uncharacterized RDD family membrane protein YckC